MIFTVYSQNPLASAFLCQLAEIPLRLAHSREPAYGLLTDRVPEPEPERLLRHEVRRQLDLVASVGFEADDDRLSLEVSEIARHRAARLLASRGVDRAEPWAVIHAGSTASARRYEPSSFAHAADALAREHGWGLVFVGTDADRDAVREVRERMREPSVTARTSRASG